MMPIFWMQSNGVNPVHGITNYFLNCPTLEAIINSLSFENPYFLTALNLVMGKVEPNNPHELLDAFDHMRKHFLMSALSGNWCGWSKKPEFNHITRVTWEMPPQRDGVMSSCKEENEGIYRRGSRHAEIE